MATTFPAVMFAVVGTKVSPMNICGRALAGGCPAPTWFPSPTFPFAANAFSVKVEEGNGQLANFCPMALPVDGPNEVDFGELKLSALIGGGVSRVFTGEVRFGRGMEMELSYSEKTLNKVLFDFLFWDFFNLWIYFLLNFYFEDQNFLNYFFVV